MAAASSLEYTVWSALLRIAVGTLFDRPKRSQCFSYASRTARFPSSHFPPADHTCGCRLDVSVSSVEYWTLKSKGPRSGDSYCTAFCRRSWKRAELLVPKPKRRKTALVEVKLPLETPRKEMSSPYSLNGVSKRPSFTRPQRSCFRPTHESRCA